MKIKYILHGGSAQHVNEENDIFYKEILKDTPYKVKILLVHFAGTDEKATINYERDTTNFLRNKEDRVILFEVATKDRFIEQIRNSDIVYMGGGTTVKLMDELLNFPNLKEAFKGKVIAGESAGANVLSTYCYSKSGGGIMKCLGILPVFMFPHYDNNENIEIKEIPNNLERLLLPNYKFKVFEVKQ